MHPFDWDPKVQRLRRREPGESRPRYLLNRLLVALATLAGVALVTFFLFQLLT
jgi:hypothetical protein